MSDRTFTCHSCGAEAPAKARACPACGADEQTGWSDERHYDGTGIEDPAEFDDEEWPRREAGAALSGTPWVWWTVAVVLMIALLVWLVR